MRERVLIFGQINDSSRQAPLFLIWFNVFPKKKKKFTSSPPPPAQPLLSIPDIAHSMSRHKIPGTQNWEFIN